MSRYIDADALRADWLENGENEYVYDTNAFLDSIDNAPTADVAPVVHGQWEWDTEDVYECSNCGEKSHVKEVMGQPVWDYCPNCGCRMDGEDGEPDGTI